MKVVVTGGFFDDGADGAVWIVDFARETAERVVQWRPPPHLAVRAKGFAGGSLAEDGILYAAAHAAVVRIDLRLGEVTGVLHQPCMNDLHHVAVRGEQLWVANTGLSAVDVLGRGGDFIGSYAFLPAWANARRLEGADPPPSALPLRPGWSGGAVEPWPERDEDEAYFSADRCGAPFHTQKVRDFLHVNHIAFHAERAIATCFADGSLRRLDDFAVLGRLDGAHIHDGCPEADRLWLTAIDGRVFTFSEDEGFIERLRVFETGHFGWCRGLVVTPEYLVVGLTEVRREKLPRYRWADASPEGSETSVLLLDRSDGRLLGRVAVGERARHPKIYSALEMGGAR